MDSKLWYHWSMHEQLLFRIFKIWWQPWMFDIVSKEPILQLVYFWYKSTALFLLWKLLWHVNNTLTFRADVHANIEYARIKFYTILAFWDKATNFVFTCCHEPEIGGHLSKRMRLDTSIFCVAKSLNGKCRNPVSVVHWLDAHCQEILRCPRVYRCCFIKKNS